MPNACLCSFLVGALDLIFDTSFNLLPSFIRVFSEVSSEALTRP